MQLTYRGAHYNREPQPVDMVDSPIQGTYRGQAFSFSYPRHIPVPQPVHTLTYRGATYRTTETGQTMPAPRPVARPVTSPVTSLSQASAKRAMVSSNPRWQTSKAQFAEYEQTHQMHIRRRLQQRIEAAKARGDYKLLNLLQNEMQQAG
ncbi:DUF4278 domain-containing protein [Leptolyngbya sp. 7M]|uniref:DUF4278 domain-containing protein n=1 Tax=Leptolyngbya sp. 7M TaxID=2812896 RepID=UPI001B8C86CE|nr:DUF4278 domain-containing protein [Leptolyngbya sp. 7M]QYO64231.1 DUF4278 domain-containing protein [Leptolyngbya sp. 7M]